MPAPSGLAPSNSYRSTSDISSAMSPVDRAGHITLLGFPEAESERMPFSSSEKGLNGQRLSTVLSPPGSRRASILEEEEEARKDAGENFQDIYLKSSHLPESSPRSPRFSARARADTGDAIPLLTRLSPTKPQANTKRCQVAQLGSEQVSLLAPDQESSGEQLHLIEAELESPRSIQLPRAFGEDVNLPPTPTIAVTRESSHDARTDPLQDVLDWLGSSQLDASQRFFPLDFNPSSEDSIALAEYGIGDRVVCRNNGTDKWMKGVVKSVHPLRVMPETWELKDERGYSWRHVQRTASDEIDEGCHATGNTRDAVRLEAQSQKTVHIPKLNFHKHRMLPMTPKQVLSCECLGANVSPSCSACCANSQTYNSEEAEWNERQRQTGSIGRLVEYKGGDDPRFDIIFRGGFDQPLVVANVADGGSAQRAGVRAGDRLVSINGKKEFVGLSADELRDSDLCKPPALFVFLGFVGKLQAEVRLANTDKPVGIPWNHVIGSNVQTAAVQLCEQRVIDSGVASLFMAVSRNEGKKLPEQLFELHHVDARACLRHALNSRSERMSINRRESMPESEIQLTDNGDPPSQPRQQANHLSEKPCMDQLGWTPRLSPRASSSNFTDFIVETPRFCGSFRSSPRACMQKRPRLHPADSHEPVL